MRRLSEVLGAVVLLVLAVVCWNTGVSDTVFAAKPDGPPEFVSTRYSGSWIAAAAALLLVASLLLVDAVRLTVQHRSPTG